MMKIVLAAAVLGLAAPAVAQTGRLQNEIDASHAKDASQVRKQKEICKTEMETGSLVKRVRRCATRESWARRTIGENQAAREFVAANTGLIISN